MKPFQIIIDSEAVKDKDAVHYNIGIEKEQKLLHSERRIAGLTVWQKNLNTGEITKALLEPVYHTGKTVLLNGFQELKTEAGFTYQAKKVDGFTYCQALNLKNAIKQFNKLTNG
jgi:hypothetical protein